MLSLRIEPSALETVERPDPGLARGRWEAPTWVFGAVLVAAAVGSLLWALAAIRSRRAKRAGAVSR